MALWERWYMQDRLETAWRRHRPPERIAPPFEVVVRSPWQIRIRRWELADTVMRQIGSLAALGEEGLARVRAAWEIVRHGTR
jgi:hypothetical protein